MYPILPILLKDWYKAGHKFQYPADTALIYSNATPRGSRLEGVDHVVVFGIQMFIQEWLIDQFNEHFFENDLDLVLKLYKRRCKNAIGDLPNYDHIADLHKLGYLPILLKALPEGTLCPMRVPYLTIRNTKDEFYWLTNMLETLMSAETWGPITSATITYQYRKVFEQFCTATGGNREFVPWQGHNFSMRGMMGIDAAIKSGMAHLTSFYGTDTIPAIDGHELYYGANSDKELIGGSVPATEHSVMCMGGEDDEIGTFRHLITEVYPRGVVSIVSDSWDFWRVITEYLPALKNEILARKGGFPLDRVVIRPDSGDPVLIICGDPDSDIPHVQKGAIQCLWDIFGGTVNAAGYKELDTHIGLIYGDSITLERQKEILERLAAQGFASTSNLVLGIGSFTYQHVTRDTFGQAVKATYGERQTPTGRVAQPIFKKPKTDSGLKNSAKGLLQVRDVNGVITLVENVDWAWEGAGMLQPVFHNGAPQNTQTLAEIRARINAAIAAGK